MKTENPLLIKTFPFALRGYKVAHYLRETKKAYLISKQFAKCAMSIWANAEEANASQSKREFIAKLQISFKEAREATYWVRIAEGAALLTKQETESLLKDIEEILYFLSSIIKSPKRNLDI